MNTLRIEADEAHEKNEELNAKIKTLEQENLSKEQEITSLNHRNALLEEEVEKLEGSVKDAKDAANQSAQHDTQNEALQRRVQLLEEEAEENEKTLRETNEKYGLSLPSMKIHILTFASSIPTRLRQTDVKAGHYERKVQALETERDQWEAKYEEMSKKFNELQKELHELEVSISNV